MTNRKLVSDLDTRVCSHCYSTYPNEAHIHLSVLVHSRTNTCCTIHYLNLRHLFPHHVTSGFFFLFFIFFLFFALFRIGLVIFSSSATLINQVPCVKPFTTVYVLSLYCSRRRVFFFQCLILPSLAVSFAVSPSLAVSLSLLCLFFTSVLPSVFFSFVTRHLKLLSVRHKPWSGER